MTTIAWIVMLSAWGVIGFFVTKFFLLVLNTPQKSDAGQV